MSTLVVGTLANQDVQLAKAWVNFNGVGTVAIRSDFNVSSLTDNGTGTYKVNFVTPMSDSNYAVSSSFATNTTTLGESSYGGSTSLATSSSVYIITANSAASSLVDVWSGSIIIFSI